MDSIVQILKNKLKMGVIKKNKHVVNVYSYQESKGLNCQCHLVKQNIKK